MPDLAESLYQAPLPATRDELLARIDIARRSLDAIVASAAPGALPGRRDAAGWRAVDHLLHVAAWERMIVAHLASGSEHEIAGVERARFDEMSLDEINHALFLRTRALQMAGALAEYRHAHSAIVAHLRSMRGEAFSAPYWANEPGGRAVMEKVAGDTYRHYIEHGGWIEGILGDGR